MGLRRARLDRIYYKSSNGRHNRSLCLRLEEGTPRYACCRLWKFEVFKLEAWAAAGAPRRISRNGLPGFKLAPRREKRSRRRLGFPRIPGFRLLPFEAQKAFHDFNLISLSSGEFGFTSANPHNPLPIMCRQKRSPVPWHKGKENDALSCFCSCSCLSRFREVCYWKLCLACLVPLKPLSYLYSTRFPKGRQEGAGVREDHRARRPRDLTAKEILFSPSASMALQTGTAGQQATS